MTGVRSTAKVPEHEDREKLDMTNEAEQQTMTHIATVTVLGSRVKLRRVGLLVTSSGEPKAGIC